MLSQQVERSRLCDDPIPAEPEKFLRLACRHGNLHFAAERTLQHILHLPLSQGRHWSLYGERPIALGKVTATPNPNCCSAIGNEVPLQNLLPLGQHIRSAGLKQTGALHKEAEFSLNHPLTLGPKIPLGET